LLSIKSPLRRAAPILAVAALAAGCGGHGALSLAQLASNQDAYVGKEVSTAGVVEVQTNADGSHYYVLADPQQDLVGLRPASRVARYRGRRVRVRGRFSVDRRAGRLIRVEQIAGGG
jgi:hypothetical protein